MTWSDATVTNAGLLLLQQVLEGKQLYLDYSVGGIGTVPPDTLKEQTSLVNPRQQFPIVQSKDVQYGKQVGSLITNIELTSSYQMTQFGIWAHIDSQAPVLMVILQDQDDEGLYVPSRTDIPEYHFVFYANIAFSNEAPWHFTIDPTLMRPRLDMVDPTSTTPGAISQFYLNVDTGSLYVCIDTSGGVYTWMQITIGGFASGAAILGASHLGAAYLMERS